MHGPLHLPSCGGQRPSDDPLRPRPDTIPIRRRPITPADRSGARQDPRQMAGPRPGLGTTRRTGAVGGRGRGTGALARGLLDQAAPVRRGQWPPDPGGADRRRAPGADRPGAVARSGAIRRRRPGRPRLRLLKVAGDKAYSSPTARRHLRGRGITPVIPTKSDERRAPRFDLPPIGSAIGSSA